jgi:ATP-dependent RNA helicase RhlE
MQTCFEQLGLESSLVRALREHAYQHATPIQAQAIPPALEGKDLVGIAQTGTGKTAAFALPTLHRLVQPQDAEGAPRSSRKGAPPRALVLVPTRELAMQVSASFAKYGQFTPLRTAVIFGGVGQQPQVRALQRGVDAVVATPGRLLDLMQQGFVRLTHVEMLVLDEADQMLDMGFLPALKRIVGATPPARQTMMFSATMPEEIRRLAAQWLRNPHSVQASPVASTIDAVEQTVFFVDAKQKPRMLAHYLQNTAWERTLVFVRTKHGADKVVKLLERSGIRASAIHGNKSQNARSRTLEQFKSSQPPVLVATDVASRGLDIRGVSHVINYELPEAPEVYVHRIGRTGRAGASGIAVALCSRDERSRLRMIEKLTRSAVQVAPTPAEFAVSETATADLSEPAAESRGRRPSSARGQRPRRNGSGATEGPRRDRREKPAATAAAEPVGVGGATAERRKRKVPGRRL